MGTIRNSRYDQSLGRLAPPELTESLRLLDEGWYFRALEEIHRLQPDSQTGPFCKTWAALQYLITARARFHLGDDPSAIQCLVAAASTGAVQESLDLAIQHASVDALIKRRRAHRLWKMGKPESARHDAESVVEAFRKAEALAVGDTFKLAGLNAALNRIYSLGLVAAIDCQSNAENPQLLMEAIVIEAEIRDWSPPRLRNDAVGMTIIADLARGADLTVGDAHNLADTNVERLAAQRVLPNPNREWPEALLGVVDVASRALVKVQALILGAELVLSERYAGLNPANAYAIQLRLMDVLLALQKESGGETPLTAQIRQTIGRIADKTKTPFPGRRVFR